MSTITLPGGHQTTFRRINVGCGFDLKPDYINVDLNDFHGPDVVSDIIDLDGFPSQTFDEVYAKDVLEHFPWRMAEYAMRSWNRVLVQGGGLRLVTTYLPGLARRILSAEYGARLSTQHVTMVNLFSSQGYPGDFHCAAFTERQIRFYTSRAGFTVQSVAMVDDWLIDVVLTKADHRENGDIQTGDDLSFVTGLYETMLQRGPDAAGLDGWLSRLSAAELTRKDVVVNFLGSGEYQDLMMREMDAFDPGTLTLGI